jgi:hypothetical protein
MYKIGSDVILKDEQGNMYSINNVGTITIAESSYKIIIAQN